MKFEIVQTFEGRFDIYVDNEPYIEGYADLNGLPCEIVAVRMDYKAIPIFKLKAHALEFEVPMFAIVDDEHRADCMLYYATHNPKLTMTMEESQSYEDSLDMLNPTRSELECSGELILAPGETS